MEVADSVVVMNTGRVEQVDEPRVLYDRPVNEFVMGFVGRVTRIGDLLVRPHDIEIRLDPNGSTHPAVVERVVHLGFEVRVELELAGGERTSVQVTRDEARRLHLSPGLVVHLRPSSVMAAVPAS